MKVSERMRGYRTRLRAAGLRLVQLWVPDTRSKRFAAECRRQSRLVKGTLPKLKRWNSLRARARGTTMRRGDLVTVAAPGDYGKPRPALVIQSDLFDELPSVTLCLVTSTLRDAPIFRITVDPSPANGLQRISQVQVDKVLTVARERIGGVIGRLDDDTLLKVNRSLAVFVGIA